MAPATDALAAAAATVRAADPFRPLLSNRDGAVVKSGPEWLDRIINQVSAPVRWDMCMQTMETLGVTAMIELPPAGTLTGLAKRALRGIQLVSLKTPDDLDAALALLAEHADSHDDHHAPEWRLLVAPTAGTFRAPAGFPDAAAAGSLVGAGTDLGHVETRGGRSRRDRKHPGHRHRMARRGRRPGQRRAAAGPPPARADRDGAEPAARPAAE